MGFKCGIVGLPNVGKSTLFNALTSTKNAEAANFPFCTIDPNIGVVDVPDSRLDTLAKLSNSKKNIYYDNFCRYCWISKRCIKRRRFGNKFLSHIREVDAIIHLVRCFESENIQHVNNRVNPVEDLETINTEIALSDIETVQKKLEKSKKKLLSHKEIEILEKSLEVLNNGNKLNSLEHLSKRFLSQIGLLSLKPKIIVCNVDEVTLKDGNKHTFNVKKSYPKEKIITICADIEDQLSSLSKDERSKFMREIGLEKMGISKLIKEGYDLLGLETFLPLEKRKAEPGLLKKILLRQKPLELFIQILKKFS